MNKFEQRYTEELEPIELEGVTFHVKLPTTANKRFQRAVLAQVIEQNDDGEFVTRETNLDEMVAYQVDAFIRTCIRSVDNWDEFTVDNLLAMPDACEDLWSAVSELTKEKEEEKGSSKEMTG